MSQSVHFKSEPPDSSSEYSKRILPDNSRILEYNSFKICRMRRRPNFSAQELDIMLDYLYHHHGLVTGSPCDTLLTSNDHRHSWDLMAHKVNQVGCHHRSGRELRFKWRDLKYKVKLKTTASALEYGKLSQTEEKILAILQKGQSVDLYATSPGVDKNQASFLETSYIGDDHNSSDSSAAQTSFYDISFPPTSTSQWNMNNEKQGAEEHQQDATQLCRDSSDLQCDKDTTGSQEELDPGYQEPVISLNAEYPSCMSTVEDSPVMQLFKQHAEEQAFLRDSIGKVESLLTQQVTLMHQMLALSTKRHATEERLVTLLEENRLMLVPKGS